VRHSGLDIKAPQFPFSFHIRGVPHLGAHRQSKTSGPYVQRVRNPTPRQYFRCVTGLHGQVTKAYLRRERGAVRRKRANSESIVYSENRGPYEQVVRVIGHGSRRLWDYTGPSREVGESEPNRVRMDCSGTAMLDGGTLAIQAPVRVGAFRLSGRLRSAARNKLCASP